MIEIKNAQGLWIKNETYESRENENSQKTHHKYEYTPLAQKIYSQREVSQWIIDCSYIYQKVAGKFKNFKWYTCIILGIVGIILGWYSILTLNALGVTAGVLIGFGIGIFLFVLGLAKLEIKDNEEFKLLAAAIAIIANGIAILVNLHNGLFIGLGILVIIVGSIMGLTALVVISGE